MTVTQLAEKFSPFNETKFTMACHLTVTDLVESSLHFHISCFKIHFNITLQSRPHNQSPNQSLPFMFSDWNFM